MSDTPRVNSKSIPMPPVNIPAALHVPISPRRLEDYWRREAELQASRVRQAQHMIDFERSRSRWAWLMWGVIIGSLLGWCAAVWRLN